jgi:N-acetyl-1-D-myo-inositol-2-amino-2-deoxy-alpha-D-glucopyranoside deacetylase
MTDATLPLPEPGERVPVDAEEAVLAAAATAVDGAAEGIDIEALDTPRRLLLVHAHPDDETIGTGATMARYASEGAAVTLVTCTLGEEGEVLVPELAHLASDRDDALGAHRVEELAAACEALRVTDHRFLGGPGRWRDSGMMGTPSNERPDCFWQAPFEEAGPGAGRGHARDRAAGGRHLRRQRGLRASGPHPGPSGDHGCI